MEYKLKGNTSFPNGLGMFSESEVLFFCLSLSLSPFFSLKVIQELEKAGRCTSLDSDFGGGVPCAGYRHANEQHPYHCLPHLGSALYGLTGPGNDSLELKPVQLEASFVRTTGTP